MAACYGNRLLSFLSLWPGHFGRANINISENIFFGHGTIVYTMWIVRFSCYLKMGKPFLGLPIFIAWNVAPIHGQWRTIIPLIRAHAHNAKETTCRKTPSSNWRLAARAEWILISAASKFAIDSEVVATKTIVRTRSIDFYAKCSRFIWLRCAIMAVSPTIQSNDDQMGKKPIAQTFGARASAGRTTNTVGVSMKLCIWYCWHGKPRKRLHSLSQYFALP